jgi:DNA-binding IclR family transcriptional regulator
VRLGYVLPLLTSASGQVFLAHLDRQDVRTRLLEEEEAPFEATETAAPRRPEDLEALVRSVRERGYATTAGNLNASFAAVSAPVFDYSGRIVAAMTVLGSERLMAGSLRDVAITALLEGAARLSERLGFDTRKIPASESAEAPVRNRRKRPAASAGG